MIINELELKNIRSHVKTRISFNKGITVLSGRTGCGKSTILMSIAYALFGSSSGISNNALLRRNTTEGYVKITFTHRGHEYEVMRGVKRGKTITVNQNKLWIKEDGKALPIIARTTEVNEKIIEVIGYPSDVNPRELFELISYAKQDEIRKLIEMTTSEREKYIDRVLQLNKYEQTYDNLRHVINKLNNESSRLKGLITGLARAPEELKNKELKLREAVSELEKINQETTSDLSQIEKEREALRRRVAKLEEDKTKQERVKGLINGYSKELERVISELSKLTRKEKSRLKELLDKQVKINSEIMSLKNQINSLTSELNDFKQLKGKCPTCHQEISAEHSSKFINQLTEHQQSLEESMKQLINQKIRLEEQAMTERRIDEEIKKRKELTIRREELSNELTRLKEQVMNNIDEELRKTKNDYEKVNNDYLTIKSRINELNNRKLMIKNNIRDLTAEVSRLKKEAEQYNESIRKLDETNKKTVFLKKIRDDIRSIRVMIRARFLEDFRHEFQKKYEEIRQDDNYSVDINNNYEPIAYADRTETSVSSLSGGEKTSVALAYRLALSELATRISSVNNNELLMLDEPTTGFDRKDIMNLPSMLRRIRIPQVIIITHEDELKEAADEKYELTKVNNETIIN